MDVGFVFKGKWDPLNPNSYRGIVVGTCFQTVREDFRWAFV